MLKKFKRNNSMDDGYDDYDYPDYSNSKAYPGPSVGRDVVTLGALGVFGVACVAAVSDSVAGRVLRNIIGAAQSAVLPSKPDPVAETEQLAVSPAVADPSVTTIEPSVTISDTVNTPAPEVVLENDFGHAITAPTYEFAGVAQDTTLSLSASLADKAYQFVGLAHNIVLPPQSAPVDQVEELAASAVEPLATINAGVTDSLIPSVSSITDLSSMGVAASILTATVAMTAGYVLNKISKNQKIENETNNIRLNSGYNDLSGDGDVFLDITETNSFRPLESEAEYNDRLDIINEIDRRLDSAYDRRDDLLNRLDDIEYELNKSGRSRLEQRMDWRELLERLEASNARIDNLEADRAYFTDQTIEYYDRVSAEIEVSQSFEARLSEAELWCEQAQQNLADLYAEQAEYQEAGNDNVAGGYIEPALQPQFIERERNYG